MFPSVFIESSSTENENEDTGVDFSFDYSTGQHIMTGFKLKECNQLESVRQYIQNVLKTPANTYKDYTKGETDVFGISIYDYIGTKTLPLGYVNSELKREVTELLLKHPLISDVVDWKSERVKRGLNISFTTVLTDNSLIEVSENIAEVMTYV